jgi:hypothetical protein
LRSGLQRSKDTAVKAPWPSARHSVRDSNDRLKAVIFSFGQGEGHPGADAGGHVVAGEGGPAVK